MTANKTMNSYARWLDPSFYEAIPKAVLAAVAVSFASCGGDFIEEANERIAKEWDILHVNGIVPQPVPARFRVTDEPPAHDRPSKY